ncbi:MAG: RNA polymerase sigma factor [Phycisphaerae bacterium]
MATAERYQRAIAGDIAELSELLREAAPQLRPQIVINNKWQSVLDVEDVLQVTFVEAFLRIQSFDNVGDGAFLAWLRRIADNNLKDAIKGLERKKRPPPTAQAIHATGDSVVDLFALLGVTTTTPSRVIAKGEMQHSLDAALNELPPDYANVIRLYDLQGLAMAEIATRMQRSPGALHMLRTRGHARLKEIIGVDPFFATHA